MTNDAPTSHVPPQPLSARLRAVLQPGQRWFALILFGLALLIGLAASALWQHSRAKQPAPATTGAAIAADPTHPPLPTPTPGALSTLPPAAQSTAGTAYIASTPAAAEPDVETAASGSTQATQEPAASSGEAMSGDSEAQVIERNQPDYPVESLRAHEEGEVRLQVALDALGNVEDVRIAGTSGSRTLDSAAMEAVRGWHFRPARHAGEAISGSTEVSVNFQIDDQR